VKAISAPFVEQQWDTHASRPSLRNGSYAAGSLHHGPLKASGRHPFAHTSAALPPSGGGARRPGSAIPMPSAVCGRCEGSGGRSRYSRATTGRAAVRCTAAVNCAGQHANNRLRDQREAARLSPRPTSLNAHRSSTAEGVGARVPLELAAHPGDCRLHELEPTLADRACLHIDLERATIKLPRRAGPAYSRPTGPLPATFTGYGLASSPEELRSRTSWACAGRNATQQSEQRDCRLGTGAFGRSPAQTYGSCTRAGVATRLRCNARDWRPTPPWSPRRQSRGRAAAAIRRPKAAPPMGVNTAGGPDDRIQVRAAHDTKSAHLHRIRRQGVAAGGDRRKPASERRHRANTKACRGCGKPVRWVTSRRGLGCKSMRNGRRSPNTSPSAIRPAACSGRETLERAPGPRLARAGRGLLVRQQLSEGAAHQQRHLAALTPGGWPERHGSSRMAERTPMRAPSAERNTKLQLITR